ncbi:MAG: hypothetical protein J0H74_04625 [Chitinophagaceae bacterium]|nr:hypothetical protein [Chitinophagaceae bacterium]
MSTPIYKRQLFLSIYFMMAVLAVRSQPTLPAAYPTTSLVNYIRTWDATAPEQDANVLVTRPLRDVKQATSFIDGLGRSLQTIVKGGSLNTGSNPSDMVMPVEYDAVGREVYKYLPFAANSTGGNTSVNDGAFKVNPFQQQVAFYNQQLANEPAEINIGANQLNYAYSQTNYEPSPLNRVSKTLAPGVNWAGSDKGINAYYLFNTAADSVRGWIVTIGVTGTFSTYASPGAYPPGQLSKLARVDENGKQIIEFRDKQGKIVLKKVQLSAAGDNGSGSGHSGWLCTYYIYNDLEELSAVLQPRGVELINANWLLTDAMVLAEQCFRYEYDQRQRMIIKQVPGAQPVGMIYDARDRLVMVQDGNMRTKNQYLVTLYDDLNRTVQTGLLLNTFNNYSFTQHLAAAAASTAYPFSVDNQPAQFQWMTQTGYDDYSNLPAASNLTATLDNTYTTAAYINTSYNASPDYAQQPVLSTQTREYPTWTQQRIVETLPVTGHSILYSLNLYDNKGRLIQEKKLNSLGGQDVITTQYNWAGQVIHKAEKYDRAGWEVNCLLTQLSYDDLGRLIQTDQKLGSGLIKGGALPGNWTTTVRNEYDPLGQLKRQNLGNRPGASVPLAKQDYLYNIRGWMLSLNKDYITGADTIDRYFSIELGYDKNASFSTFSAQYNGNIAGMLWKSAGDQKKRKYDFTYDAANRLMTGTFTQYVSGSGSSAVFDNSDGLNFSIGNLSYDANGNIKSMGEYAWKPSGTFTLDNLQYNYNSSGKSNKLQNVIDLSNDPTTVQGDFRANQQYMTALGGTKTAAAVDYSYDPNGNLSKDRNKSIDTIKYNYLNLPDSIVFNYNGELKYITYFYDPSGTKIYKRVDEPGQEVSTETFYLGPNMYSTGGSLDGNAYNFHHVSLENGRIRYTPIQGPDSAKLDYDYFLKDHLGNVRSVVTEETKTDAYQTLAFEGTTAEINNQYNQWENSSGNYMDIVALRTAWPSSFLATYGSNSANGAYGMQIKKSTGAIGAGKLLKVMVGDTIHTSVDYYYNAASYDNHTANGKSSLVSVISSVLAGLAPSPASSILKSGAADVANNLNNSTAVTSLFTSQNAGTTADTRPKAYLNILFFDNQFRLDQTNSVAIAVTASPGTKGTIDKKMANAIRVRSSGYVYLYFSNESETPVFFDNFMLTHVRGRLLEETHYYPFGLTMAGISDKALKSGYAENKHRYNGGNELQNKEFSDGSGLEAYDANFRMYDPQIGRFFQIDPLSDLSENWSGYAFVQDNPNSFSDPMGLTDSVVGLMPYAPAPIITPPPPAPHKDLNVDLATVSGYNQQDHNFFLNFVVDRTIGTPPTWWQRLTRDDGYVGKNLLGEDVFIKYYTGTPPIPSFSRFNPRDVLKIYKIIKNLQWSSRSVAKAAKLLLNGAKEVTVKNKAEAEELYLAIYMEKGYTNTTGMSAKEVRDFFPEGKGGTYHWDLNDTQHGGIPHLQIHDGLNIIRIFFEL